MSLSAVDPQLEVLVIGTNPLARVGLVSLLSALVGLVVVGEAADGDDLTDQVEQLLPDAIVWDFGWDAEVSAEALEVLNTEDAIPPVVVLLSDESDLGAAQAAGAAGFLSQTSPAEQIAAAVAAVVNGLIVFDAEFQFKTAAPRTSSPEQDLTPREKEVLQLLAQGLANKAIAMQLGISDHTVKFHVNAILTKLDAQSRTEAVVMGMKLGLIVL